MKMTWFQSLDGASQFLFITIAFSVILLFWALIRHMLGVGVYHEEELERGSIVQNGNLIGYYRIVKRYYQNSTTKIKTERIKLP